MAAHGPQDGSSAHTSTSHQSRPVVDVMPRGCRPTRPPVPLVTRATIQTADARGGPALTPGGRGVGHPSFRVVECRDGTCAPTRPESVIGSAHREAVARASKKVIFLDIDGVMNSHDTCTDHELGLVSWLDARNIAILNEIAQATGAVVVVSSTWRLTMPFAELCATFAAAGCVAEVLDVTPDIDARQRDLEIQAWLVAKAEPPSRYVILDDDRDMPALPEKLVKTCPSRGLSRGDISAVLALLGD